MRTRWELFHQRWMKGCGSSLCANATYICLKRGTIPCEILFVGEAPSVGADVTGRPFVGESGVVLDDVIKRAGALSFTRAYTNVVACIPRHSEDRCKTTQPPDEAVQACQPRLREFIALCKPKLIVAVGRVAERWLRDMQAKAMFPESIPVAHIMHPSHILQCAPYNGYQFSQAVQALAKAVEQHVTDVSG